MPSRIALELPYRLIGFFTASAPLRTIAYARDASSIDVNGALYGTTYYGEAYLTDEGGRGTVFSLRPAENGCFTASAAVPMVLLRRQA